MIGVATTIKDNPSHTFFFRTLGNEFANFACPCNFAIIGNSNECLFRCLPLTLLCSRQHGFDLSSRLATLCLGFSRFLRLSRFFRFSPFSLHRCSLCSYSYSLCLWLCPSFHFNPQRGLGRTCGNWLSQLEISQTFIK